VLFVANESNVRTENFTKLEKHLLGYQEAIRLHQRALSVFFRPIVKEPVENKEWPNVRIILNTR
jgi:hypothetical protein